MMMQPLIGGLTACVGTIGGAVVVMTAQTGTTIGPSTVIPASVAVAAVLLGCGLFFKAGRWDQRLFDMERRVDRLEDTMRTKETRP